MSSKKNESLRNAMAALKVNEPLRLSKNGPGLKPPESSKKNGEEVPQNEAPPSGGPQSELPQNEVAQNEHPRSELPQNGVAPFEAPQKEQPPGPKTPEIPRVSYMPQNEQPQMEMPRNKDPQYGVARFEQPQNEGARNEVGQIEGPQKEVAQVEFAQIEVTQSEGPQFEEGNDRKSRTGPRANGSTNGGSFFRLSDRAFSSPLLQRLSGDSFRLFLWMSSRAWRYVKSEGTLRASIGFIEEGTAMSHATISRCIKTLRDDGLIRLIETDYKRGNVWQVSPIAFAGLGPGDLPPRFEVPKNEGAQNGVAAPSKRGGGSLNLREKEPQNEVEIRSLKKIQEVSSQEGALFARIENIRATAKQKSERECLLQLLETYSPVELEMAVAFLEKNGVLGSHQPCHSLFRYLVSAADDVLKEARKQQRVAVVPVAVEEADSEQVKVRAQAALAAFESQLSETERETFISSYVEREYTWGYVPSKSLVTRLAADRWYSQQEGQLQARAG